MEQEQEWLTTAEVAEMFRVTQTTVTRWCNNGKYPKKYLQRTNGYAKGSKWLIHKDALKPKEPAARQYWAEQQRAKESVAKTLEILANWGKKKKPQ